jgi:ketosteroid isomerase-like protein
MRLSPFLALSLVCLLASAPATAGSGDAAINAVYSALARARAANDVAGMSSAFEGNALLVDARPGPPISGAELGDRLRPMATRIQADGVKVETAYRIERRTLMGDLAMDAGYMRQTMVRPNGQRGARYARFLVAMRRDPSGGWRIVGDASMPAEQAAFDALTPKEGLHFDS